MNGLKGAFAGVFAPVRDDVRVDAAANAIDDGIKDEGLGQHRKGCNDVSYSQDESSVGHARDGPAVWAIAGSLSHQDPV
jgi:hypothetical protein